MLESMKRRFLLVFFHCGLLSAMMALQSRAACTCPSYSAEDALNKATYVFQGKVSEIKTDKKSGQKTIVFDVLDYYKGEPDYEMEVVDATAGKDCAVGFEANKVYLVYACWDWGTLEVNPCSGTRTIEQALADASVVGPGDVWKEKMYEKLREECMGKRDTICCLDSVKAMQKGRFLLEPENGCSGEMVPDRLSCIGSRVWCIPMNPLGYPEMGRH